MEEGNDLWGLPGSLHTPDNTLEASLIPPPTPSQMRLDRPPARILMLVVGFVGLRKQGEIQSPRDGRDAILHTSLTAVRSVAAGHKRRSTFESPIRNRCGRTRLLEIRRA